MPRLLTLQHVEPETIGTIAAALDARGIAVDCVRVFDGEPVPPQIGAAAGLIVMGGPMGVYEQARYPFLADELQLIEDALHKGIPILGICLGSELLAAALGARIVKSGRQEIGWNEVTLTPAALADPLFAEAGPRFTPLCWHGDNFDLPEGATALASSAMTELQAFRYGSGAYGILFHPEVTLPIIEGMAAAFPDELRDAGVTADELLQQSRDHLPMLERISAVVFERWAGLALH